LYRYKDLEQEINSCQYYP